MTSRPRSPLVVVATIVLMTGVTLAASAWVLGSIGWLLADVPGADNDIVPELLLTGVGGVLVFLGAAGVAAGLATRGRESVSTGRGAAAVVAALVSLVVAVGGAAAVASRAVADILAPVLERPQDLYRPGYDGWAVIAVACGLAVLGLGLLVLQPAARRPGTRTTSPDSLPVP